MRSDSTDPSGNRDLVCGIRRTTRLRRATCCHAASQACARCNLRPSPLHRDLRRCLPGRASFRFRGVCEKGCERLVSSHNQAFGARSRLSGRLDHAICDRRPGNRHQNSHAQSQSVRTPDGRGQGDQSRSVGSLDGRSRRGNRSSSIRQIRWKLRQAIPSPMGYPNPSSMDHTGHTRGNTLENNKDSLASEPESLPIRCLQQEASQRLVAPAR